MTDTSHNYLFVFVIINSVYDVSAMYEENKRKSRIIADLLIRKTDVLNIVIYSVNKHNISW